MVFKVPFLLLFLFLSLFFVWLFCCYFCLYFCLFVFRLCESNSLFCIKLLFLFVFLFVCFSSMRIKLLVLYKVVIFVCIFVCLFFVYANQTPCSVESCYFCLFVFRLCESNSLFCRKLLFLFVCFSSMRIKLLVLYKVVIFVCIFVCLFFVYANQTPCSVESCYFCLFVFRLCESNSLFCRKLLFLFVCFSSMRIKLLVL